MASKWFDTVFLPSLFQRAGTNKGLWLTVKQTSVCAQYMEVQCHVHEGAFGLHRSLSYSYEWEGRQVHLSYSKLNGCGQISFGYNAEEHRAATQRTLDSIRERDLEHAERMYTRRRAKWEERVNKLRELISDAEEDDAEAIADGTYNAVISRQYMDELQSELSLLLSVAH